MIPAKAAAGLLIGLAGEAAEAGEADASSSSTVAGGLLGRLGGGDSELFGCAIWS